MTLLVAKWLREVGLEYAVPNFEAAGIVTPEALAELEANHFGALGVEKVEDRRKLFFMVQRIKQEVEKERNRKAARQDEADGEVLAESAMNESRNETATAAGVQASNGTRENNKQTTVAPRGTREAENEQCQTQALPNSQVDDYSSFNDFADDDDDDDMGTTTSGGQSADDEATDCSSNHRGRQPESRLVSSSMDGDEVGASNVDPSASFGSRNSKRSGLRRPNSSLSGSTGRKSVSGLPSRSSTGGVSSSTRRLSGVPLPSSLTNSKSTGRKSLPSALNHSSRSSTHHPKSMRTGKQLRPIPSNSAAPMSPLVDLPMPAAKGSRIAAATSSSEEDTSTANTASRLPPRRRGTHSSDHPRKMSGRSGKMGASDSTTEQEYNADQSSCASPTRRRHQQSLPTTKGAQSFDSGTTVRSPVKRGKARGRRTGASLSPTSSFTASSAPRRVDDSFKAQITRLREDTSADYEQFGDVRKDNAEDDMRIRVVVRKRPMSRKEISAAGEVDVIQPLDHGSFGRILVYQPRTRVDLTKEIENVPFAFDNVFAEQSTNLDLYERSVQHMIPSLFDGQWLSVFAYGQTGSGKTFTMMGSDLTTGGGGVDASTGISNFGLYYMATLDIFELIESRGERADLSISLSLFEIYGGKLYDLLNDRTSIRCLENSEGRVCFPGLTEHEVADADELLEWIKVGTEQRSTGTTSRNADSSRSHAVLQIHLNKADTKRRDEQKVEYSRLTFIDLAGSERGADTSSASRTTRMEGAEINCSLLALKEVIRAMATGDAMAHVPFRGSRLTQVLKESFVGSNCRSVMIACISPNIGNCEQTLNTLRYADRVKERDSETGAIIALAPSETTVPKPSDLSRSRSSKASGDTNGGLDVSSVSNASALLDDILSSPVTPLATGDGFFEQSEAPDDQSEAVANLMMEHKVAMTSMLEMAREEMAIVHLADSARETIEDYLEGLKEIQDRQLSFIAKLRERLQDYRDACDAGDSGDSFEDLRD